MTYATVDKNCCPTYMSRAACLVASMVCEQQGLLQRKTRLGQEDNISSIPTEEPFQSQLTLANTVNVPRGQPQGFLPPAPVTGRQTSLAIKMTGLGQLRLLVDSSSSLRRDEKKWKDNSTQASVGRFLRKRKFRGDV